MSLRAAFLWQHQASLHPASGVGQVGAEQDQLLLILLLFYLVEFLNFCSPHRLFTLKVDLTREMCLWGTGSLAETMFPRWCYAICLKLEAEHMVI